MFDQSAEADDFMSEHDAIITNTHRFQTKAQMEAFVAASVPTVKDANASVGATTPVIDLTLSPEDKTKFMSMRSAMENAKNKHEVILHVRTTKKSSIALFILEAKRDTGADMFYFKSPLDKIWSQWFSNQPEKHEFTNDFFTTMQTAKRRDPEGDVNDRLVSVRTKDQQKFPVSILWCFVNIQVEKIASATDELKWFQDNADIAWNNFRRVQLQPLWTALLHASLSEGMKTAFNVAKFGPNFSQFVQECRVVVKPLDNLNKYVILDEAKNMQLLLVKNELEHKKYPNDDLLNAPIKKEPANKPLATPKKKTPSTTKATVTTPKKQKKPPAVTPNNDVANKDSDDDVSIGSKNTESEDDDDHPVAKPADDNTDTDAVEVIAEIIAG
jgi:hypothetical protein